MNPPMSIQPFYTIEVERNELGYSLGTKHEIFAREKKVEWEIHKQNVYVHHNLNNLMSARLVYIASYKHEKLFQHFCSKVVTVQLTDSLLPGGRCNHICNFGFQYSDIFMCFLLSSCNLGTGMLSGSSSSRSFFPCLHFNLE